MTKIIPNFKNRSADSIVSDEISFESPGYIYRALSWIDLAKRTRSPVAFQYAAHDARQGIEQLLFEELVMHSAPNFDRAEYRKCLGASTRLHAIINRLAPEREKLARFTQAVYAVGAIRVQLVVWDHRLLMRYWGSLSNYLHWAGVIDESIKDKSWVTDGIEITEKACMYIWDNKTTKETGVMRPDDMHPEIRDLWERYREDKVDIEGVRISVEILEPATR